MGFQHAAELLRLVTQSDLYTLCGADVYTVFCALLDLSHKCIARDLTPSLYFCIARNIQKNDIKDLFLSF